MLIMSVLLLRFLLIAPLVSSSPLAKVKPQQEMVVRYSTAGERNTQEAPQDQSVCARTFCGAGRECVSTGRGEPVCRCVQECDVKEHWVCGSNGRSYRNHCELHKDACITKTKIHTEHKGPCLEKSTETDASPFVCFLSDRDWLREKVIQWIQAEVDADSVETSNVTAVNNLLNTYFEMYSNSDLELDSVEFLNFLKHNESALNITYSNTLETNLLLRSLCVDALIELSDENADWKLSLSEFINCLTPSYHPYERKCALEDEVFEDGAETRMECNKCVCACGNWVCTALTCTGEQAEEHIHEGEEQEEMTEEEWSRRVAELNAVE